MLATLERLCQKVEALAEVGARGGLLLIGHARGEEGAEILVHFGVDVTQPLVQPVACERAMGGREAAIGLEIPDIREDGRAFRQNLPAIEAQRRHVILGCDLCVLFATRGLLAAALDLDRFER